MAVPKHEMSKHRLYNIWRHIKKRCRLKTNSNYQYCGGRGINVCDEWYDSFEVFRDWAFGNGYADGLSIDRIEVNGNYEPSNCRWTTQDVQMKNRRNILAKLNQEPKDEVEECPF